MRKLKLFGILGAFACVGFGLVVAPGCHTQRVATETVKKDSVDVRYVERVEYQPVFIPGDTVTFTLPNPCPDGAKPNDASSSFTGKRANVYLRVKDGVITGTAICNAWRDSVATLNRQLDRLYKSQATASKVVSVPYEVVKEVVPKWAWYCLGFSIICLLYWVLRLLLILAPNILPKPLKTLIQWLK